MIGGIHKMHFDYIEQSFIDSEFWKLVVAGVLVAAIVAIAGLITRRILKTKRENTATPSINVATTGPESSAQVAVGDETSQIIRIDKSRDNIAGERSVIIKAEKGATVNINVYNYQDGMNQTAPLNIRKLFNEGHAHYIEEEWFKAINIFKQCLSLEEDHERLGAINIQIGNCYYKLQYYERAGEFYSAALAEARKANDREGEASAMASIGNTYILRKAIDGRERGENIRRAVQKYKDAFEIFKKDEYPVQYATTQNNLGTVYTDLPSATPEERAQNVRKAIECYKAALEIYKKDEYPVDYAMTQNNLGNAYTDLPSATPEERAQNVRKAIECYKAALEIRKKDEYPQDFCRTATNYGMLLAILNDKEACHWLREAYALREYLPDQGERYREYIEKYCIDI